jgi:hypothetical protein
MLGWHESKTANAMNAEDQNEESDEFDPTPEELSLIRQATPVVAEEVDALILSRCTNRWGKVAMIVGSLLDDFEAKYPYLPYVYMQVRMLELEHQGRLEIAGDVMQVRASEVRLPITPQ